MVCLPLLVPSAFATGKVHQHALDLYSRLRTANTNVLVSPATRSVGLHQPSPVTPQATSISLSQPAQVSADFRELTLCTELQPDTHCSNTVVVALTGPTQWGSPDLLPSSRVVTLVLPEHPDLNDALKGLCATIPVPCSSNIAPIDLVAAVPAVSNVPPMRVVTLYVPGSSNTVALAPNLCCHVPGTEFSKTRSIDTSTLSAVFPDMRALSVTGSDLYERFFTEQKSMALAPVRPPEQVLSSMIPCLHCTIESVHTNIAVLVLSDAIDKEGRGTNSPIRVASGFSFADTHVTNAAPCSSLALRFANLIVRFRSDPIQPATSSCATQRSISSQCSVGSTPQAWQARSLSRSERDQSSITLAFSAPGQSGTPDLVSRSFKLAPRLPEHDPITPRLHLVRSSPIPAPVTPPFRLHSPSIPPCELSEHELTLSSEVFARLQHVSIHAVALNVVTNADRDCLALVWQPPVESGLAETVSVRALSFSPAVDAAPVFISCSDRSTVDVTLSTVTLISPSISGADYVPIGLVVRKDAIANEFSNLSAVPALEKRCFVRAVDVSVFSLEAAKPQPMTRAPLTPLALEEHARIFPKLTRFNITSYEPTRACVARIDRVLIDQILDAAKQGTINPRNPKNREDVVWFLTSYPFTPEAYEVFQFMLRSCAGNTDRKKTDSMRSWAEEYRAGKYSCIVAYYGAYHLYDSSDFIGASRVIADYLKKYSEHRDRILVLDALCAAQRGENRAALSSLDEVCSGRHGSAMIPKATFLIAWVHFQESNINDARTVLEDLVREYPESESAGKAKQILASLTNRE